jgi:DNA polymerase-3 subunit epsilon
LTRSNVLDTETTGFDFATDRVVEVGIVEVVDGAPTGRTFHRYVNPGRPVPAEATAVHGLTDAFLADKPMFSAIVDELIDFLGSDEIVAHNAGFDVGFLSAEIGTPIGNPVVDTLAIARRKHPGSPASLDALCSRYKVDSRRRTKHGALVDAELLAEVYVRMSATQGALDLSAVSSTAHVDGAFLTSRPCPLAPRLTPADVAAHEAMVATIPNAIWIIRYSALRENTYTLI